MFQTTLNEDFKWKSPSAASSAQGKLALPSRHFDSIDAP
jgi:hypothetical protein